MPNLYDLQNYGVKSGIHSIIYESLAQLRITIEHTENITDKLYGVFGRINP
jgi:hypothetical protein